MISAYNEAFTLACRFNCCNPTAAPMGFSSLKTTSKNLVRYVEKQREGVVGDMADFLKAERKELFNEWGLAGGKSRGDAGLERDRLGQFLGGHNYGSFTAGGQPVRTITDVIASSTRNVVTM